MKLRNRAGRCHPETLPRFKLPHCSQLLCYPPHHFLHVDLWTLPDFFHVISQAGIVH
jgi:hypothetical protein